MSPGTFNNMLAVAMGSGGDFTIRSTVPVHIVAHAVGFFSPVVGAVGPTGPTGPPGADGPAGPPGSADPDLDEIKAKVCEICETLGEPPPRFCPNCEPQSCGTFTDCEPGPDFCLCFELISGGGSCLSDAPCGAACSAHSDCAAGEVCITNTCCGYANCVPNACGAGRPESSGGATNAFAQ